MAKMSRFNKIPWWLQILSGATQEAPSAIAGAPSLTSMRRASKNPKVIKERLDELFDGSPVVKFYLMHTGVKIKDLVQGARERGYEPQPSEQIGEWSLEVYALKEPPESQ